MSDQQLLEDTSAFIAGGAGAVGEGITRTLLDHGASVMVSSRSEAKLAALREYLGEELGERLLTIEGDLSTAEGAAAIEQSIEDHLGGLDIVVASLGGWTQGDELVNVPRDTFDTIIDDGITSHFMTAKALLPLLHEGGTYTMLNSGAALTPQPGAGPVSIVAAAQMMFKDVLAMEWEETPQRVNTVLLATPVLTRRRDKTEADWVHATDAGEVIARLHTQGDDLHGATITLESHEQAQQWSP